MPADEVHHEDSAGQPRARSGPRHAAPRKPLLTRLHVPAGKAIAIAAMPTAVLMGMGLTPQLAQAKPQPKNPFQDGPCVTAPDEASKDAEKEADKAAEEKAEKEKAERAEADKKDAADKSGKDDSGKATAEPTPSPSAGDKAGSDTDGADKAEPTPSDSEDKSEEPAPEPSKTKNPLDPLGVGDALKDIFTPDEKESESPEPTPSASEDTKSEDTESSESGKDPVKDTVDDVTKPVKDTVDGVTKDVEDGADKAKDEVDKAKEDAEKAADEAAEKAKEEAEDPMAPDENGKKPFPCVVEKKVDGENEQTPAPLPNQPWNLEASSLTLKGADYQGVVNVQTANGSSKQALKYVIDSTDIGDLHQIVDGPAGKKYHVQAAKGSTSTIREGKTTMYTESISGKLFGLIPITFDPEHPPPLNIPLIYFTDVKVKQAGQFGGTLHIPGLHQTITD
ncbi:hypothetical protein ABZ916_00045 [Streptomyces sp. NPDC046853]|uniref:hypothetical protein n=1 Tax=Streptomyces sp. NPDC046853 TaxID=3154920 RepID=UPI0033CF8502